MKASAAAAAAQREIDVIEETLAPLTEEAIIDSVPKTYQRKERLLLRHLTRVAPERLKWSNAGTVSIDDRMIECSNIIELLNDVVRRRGKNDDEEAPVRRMEFSKFVKTYDTATNLIGISEVLKIGRILTAPFNMVKRRLNKEDANAEPSPVLTRRRKAEQTKKKAGYHFKYKTHTRTNTHAHMHKCAETWHARNSITISRTRQDTRVQEISYA